MAKRGRNQQSSGNSQRPRFWGRHAVEGALRNSERVVRKLWATRAAADQLELPKDLIVVYADVADLGRMVPADAPHQGLVAEVDPLEDVWLSDIIAQGGDGPIVVLDQVTDPHNVGAVLRSAAAFGAAAIVTQDRHAPTEGGALAKAASGALEIVPWARVVNLSRALEELAEGGYWRIGLVGETQMTIEQAFSPGKIALVLGAEGEGLRHNVAQHCDVLARLPISDRVESLNVSNAAAIALYATAQRGS